MMLLRLLIVTAILTLVSAQATLGGGIGKRTL